MNNPIRRVWVPKKAEPTIQPTPSTTSNAGQVAPAVAQSRNMLFDDLPAPDVVEKNTDSIWAEFETVVPAKEPPK